MSKIYSTLGRVAWAIGMFTMVVSILLKVVPAWGNKFDATPHGLMIFAGTLFLCALASRELGHSA